MEEFKNELIDFINNYAQELPFECIFYVLKDVYRDTEASYQRYLEEIKKYKEKEEEQENESVSNE